MWIDRPWQNNYNSFIMNPDKFPNPAIMVKKLRSAGFRLAFWSSPYIHEDFEDTYKDFLDVDGFVGTPGDSWFDKFGKLVDLTNEKAIALFKALIQNAITLGAEGFKLDYAEDVQAGALGANLPFKFANGQSEKTMHKGYAMYYHKPYAELVGGSGKGFILSRAGTYGDQAYTTTIWPGDLCNSFHKHKEDKHVGGLPAAIIGGLSVSTSGYPWYASDTGGYRHGRSPKEVFLRWTAYSALGSVMQTGGGNSYQVPWDFKEYSDGHGGKSVYDQETLNIYRLFARLHQRLYAYKYIFNQRAHETGRPITSPLGFMYPELGKHPDFQFVLGDDLMVAPVIDATGEVTVILPEGDWYDFWTHKKVTGPTEFKREVSLDSIALYVRAGAIVPLLHSKIDTLAPSSDPDINSYANDPGVLVIRVYPGAESASFETLGDTQINVVGNELTVTGTHFKGYRVEAIQPDATMSVLEAKSDTPVTLWEKTE